jgi:hypothetical protein
MSGEYALEFGAKIVDPLGVCPIVILQSQEQVFRILAVRHEALPLFTGL